MNEFETPLNEKSWKKNERSTFAALLSPPQREAVALCSALSRKTLQEYVVTVIEEALLRDLERHCDRAEGGKFAQESYAMLLYLQKWGDLSIKRSKLGRPTPL